MKIKQKKGQEGGMFWIITGGLVAAVVAGILLFTVPKGLFAQSKNIDYLSSCKNKGGTCQATCEQNQDCFFKVGCPFDENGDGKIDNDEKKNEYCHIPES